MTKIKLLFSFFALATVMSIAVGQVVVPEEDCGCTTLEAPVNADKLDPANTLGPVKPVPPAAVNRINFTEAEAAAIAKMSDAERAAFIKKTVAKWDAEHKAERDAWDAYVASPKTEEWTKALKATAAKEQAAIFYDLTRVVTWKPPVTAYEKAQGAATMRALAGSSWQAWKQIDGVQFFTLSPYRKPAERPDKLVNVVKWMNQLNPKELADLAGNGLVFSRIPTAIRADLLSNLSDRDMHFALLGHEKETVVQLKIEPLVQVPLKNNADQSPSISLINWNRVINKVNVPLLPENAEVWENEILQPQPTGPLDFGEGAVLSLDDILKKANAVFETNLTSTRPGSTLYFVSGQYSKSTFESVLAEINAPFKWITSRPIIEHDAATILGNKLLEGAWKNTTQSEVDLTWIRNSAAKPQNMTVEDIKQFERKFGARETLPMSWFIYGKKISVAELVQNRIGLQSFFSRLEPTTELNLSSGISINISKSGEHEVTTGFFYSGKATQANYDTIGLFE